MSDLEDQLGTGALSALGAVLRRERPDRAAAILAAFPELAAPLAEVKILGATEDLAPVTRAPGASPGKAYVEVARAGLTAACSRAERLMGTLPRRMRRARRLKFYGGVLSSFSSAGVLSALALSQRAAAVATALLGFLTSLLALVGEHMDTPLFGTRKSLGELTTELLDIEREAREQELVLMGLSEPVEVEAAVALARKVNAVAARLRVLEVIEGLTP